MSAPVLARRPDAVHFEISKLLDLAREGRLRIPRFQRKPRWQAEHNRALLDSVILGYPVGSLLFWQRPAPEEDLRFGDFQVKAPAWSNAWYVVDGQQRLTALIGVLCHPDPVHAGAGDPYALGYDLERQQVLDRARAEVGPNWVPLRELADPRLTWLHRQKWAHERPDLMDTALRVAEALRTTRIPAYVVEAESDAPLRVIFKRLNTSGVGMLDHEVFDALHGVTEGGIGTLRTLRDAVSTMGFGEIDEGLLLKAMFATRSVDPKRRSVDEMESLEAPVSLRETENAVRLAIEFLRLDAGIPSLALLPYTLPIRILTRFFHLFPHAHPRSRLLLRRWLWRLTWTGTFANTSNPAMRKLLGAIVPGEEHQSVGRLMSGSRGLENQEPLSISGTWRQDTAAARVVTLALLSLHPRGIDGGRVDTSWVIERGPGALNRLSAAGPNEACNRALLHEVPALGEWATADDDVANSHAIPIEARANVNDPSAFWEARRAAIGQVVNLFVGGLAEWGANDRPPLSAVLAGD